MTRNPCRSGHFAAALQSEFGASHRRNDAPLLVHARGGEGGDIRPGFAATPETRGRIRRAGDEAAWRAVGRPPNRPVGLGEGGGAVGDGTWWRVRGRVGGPCRAFEGLSAGTHGSTAFVRFSHVGVSYANPIRSRNAVTVGRRSAPVLATPALAIILMAAAQLRLYNPPTGPVLSDGSLSPSRPPSLDADAADPSSWIAARTDAYVIRQVVLTARNSH